MNPHPYRRCFIGARPWPDWAAAACRPTSALHEKDPQVADGVATHGPGLSQLGSERDVPELEKLYAQDGGYEDEGTFMGERTH